MFDRQLNPVKIHPNKNYREDVSFAHLDKAFCEKRKVETLLLSADMYSGDKTYLLNGDNFHLKRGNCNVTLSLHCCCCLMRHSTSVDKKTMILKTLRFCWRSSYIRVEWWRTRKSQFLNAAKRAAVIPRKTVNWKFKPSQVNGDEL